MAYWTLKLSDGETGGRSVNEIKLKAANIAADLVETLEYGSTYHGYKDPQARPSLNYRIIDSMQFDIPIPVSNEFRLL